MHITWVDGIIVLVIAYYLWEGWRDGFVHVAASFISFLGALFLAIKLHPLVGNFFASKFGVPALWATVMGYLLIALVSQSLISSVMALLVERVPTTIVGSRANQILGALISILNGLLLVTFFLLLILALPIRGTVKTDIKTSFLGNALVTISQRYAGDVESTIDEAVNEAKKFLTVPTESSEKITLDISPKAEDLKVDEESETKMRELLNNERSKIGVAPLFADAKMVEVARSYSRQMLMGRFFSHYDPNGHDAAWRLQTAGVFFVRAGENLAYAPDVDTAHFGLMNSPGHRANILDTRFRRIGIGVIDAGIYGKMFTQLFAD